MNEYPTIEVTPNVKKAMEYLKEAIDALEPGPVKKNAEGSWDYLNRTFKGEPQPLGGENCPPERLLIGGP